MLEYGGIESVLRRTILALAEGQREGSLVEAWKRPSHKVMATACMSAKPCFGLDEASRPFEAETTHWDVSCCD